MALDHDLSHLVTEGLWEATQEMHEPTESEELGKDCWNCWEELRKHSHLVGSMVLKVVEQMVLMVVEPEVEANSLLFFVMVVPSYSGCHGVMVLA